jgi:exosortase
LVLLAAAYSFSWLSFPAVWLANRSHGFVIAALCAWLIWRDRTLLAQRGTPFPPALLALLGLSLVWFVGVVVSAQVVYLSVMPLLVLSWVLAIYGEESAKVAAPIAAAFSLALPIWEALIWPLQQLTVFVNGVALKAVGLKAVISGESISIPSGTLVVADSCAGLNFLLIGLTVSVAHSLLFVGSFPTRVRLIVTATIISLVANWVRVFGLVVVAHATQMKSPLMQDHSTYGWIIFAIALVVFFWLAARIERRDRDMSRPVATSAENAPCATDLATFAPGAVIAATCAAVFGPLLFLLISAIPVSTSTEARFPGIAQGSSWTTVTAAGAAPAPWTPAYSGASEMQIQQTGSPSEVVQLNHLVYRARRQGAELISAGNRIAPDSLMIEDRYIGPLDSRARIVRQAVVRQPGGLRLIWYWYRVARTDTPSRIKAKILELPAFVQRSPSSELLAVSTSCTATDCAAAARRLHWVVTGREMPVAGTH